MDTRFDTCSRALIRVGLKPIASFEDGTAEATVAGREYEARVRAELAELRWRFSTKQAALNRLAGTPEARWRFYHQLRGALITSRSSSACPAASAGVWWMRSARASI